MKPKVNIIIPTYERLGMFKICLDSALNQTYDELIISVFDNSDSDNIQEYIRPLLEIYSNLEYERNFMNLGPGGNHRKCLKNIKGEFFYFLTSDVLLKRNCIEKMVSLSKKNKLPVVFSDSSDQLMSGEIIKTKNHYLMKNLVSPDTDVYNTEPFLRYFLFDNKPVNNIGLYENLINTQMFQNSEIGLPITGFNEEENRTSILMLMSIDKIGYVNEVLKYNLKDENCKIKIPRPKPAIIYYCRAAMIEEFLLNHRRKLIIKGINLFKLKIRLIGSYIKSLCFFEVISLYSITPLFALVLDILLSLIIYIILIPLKITFYFIEFITLFLVENKKKFKNFKIKFFFNKFFNLW